MKVLNSYASMTCHFRNLLAALVIFVIADGLLTQILINGGWAREGNPLLVPLVGTGSFIVIKVVGALISAFMLWHIYTQRPKLALRANSCLVVVYAGIVLWNLSILLFSLA